MTVDSGVFVLLTVAKLQSNSCAHMVHIPEPGSCVSGGTLVRNYGTINMAPTQKINSSSRRSADPTSKHVNSLGTNKN
jgi:hypothetical protein